MEKNKVRETLMALEYLRKKFLQPRFLSLGLTLGQGQPRILRTLKANGSMTQRELADLCHLDVTTMSRTLDRLEENGLIYRSRPPQSRRAYLIRLTQEGEEKAEKVIEYFQELDDVLCCGFSQDDLNRLYGDLSRLLDNLKAQDL
ncbi:MarR family transcriptional regulator [Catenibacillus scindens]|uniref:MarR family winged helix-turn-helix transcriptional regulator n=1 Tax=Catenibacillus scindens TaxID=673271 RepID=UPI0032088BEA